METVKIRILNIFEIPYQSSYPFQRGIRYFEKYEFGVFLWCHKSLGIRIKNN